MQEKTREMLGDGRFQPPISGVIDMRKASKLMSRAELSQFIEFMNQSEQLRGSRWALIGDDPMVIALSQIFQQHVTESENFGVFSSVEHAARFLDNAQLLEILGD